MSDNPAAAPKPLLRRWRPVVWVLAGALLIVAAAWGISLARKRGIVVSEFLLPAAFVFIALLGVLVLWKAPQWQVAQLRGLNRKERFDRENEARKTLATILGGAVLLAGGYFTWQNIQLAQQSLKASRESSENALAVSRQGQITDRFTKAIEQLGALDSIGKPKYEVRLGGIYSLEAIAKESKDLHWPIMEVLCSYVRRNAPATQSTAKAASGAQKKSSSEGTVRQVRHPGADIQAILTVLGRREHRDDWESKVQHLDLSETNLAGADLSGAHLERANFTEADLSRADLYLAVLNGALLSGATLERAELSGAHLNEAELYGAHLSKADLSWANLIGSWLNGAELSGADLTEATLRGATLSRADLSEARLSGAVLREADLSGADLFEANLRGADLRGTDLGGARDLTQQQVNIALGDADTKPPAGVCLPRIWERVTASTPNACPAPK